VRRQLSIFLLDNQNVLIDFEKQMKELGRLTSESKDNVKFL
jgi:dynein heavy chain